MFSVFKVDADESRMQAERNFKIKLYNNLIA